MRTTENDWGTTAGTVMLAGIIAAQVGCSAPPHTGSDEVVGQARQDLSGDGPDGDLVCRDAPVTLVDTSRDPTQFEDYFRMSFIKPPLPPQPINMLARMDKLRAFVTASFFFEPALPLAKAVPYVGLADQPGSFFAGFRCRPPRSTALEAELATWPTFFRIFQQDFAASSTCPPPMGATADNLLFCLARSYTDGATRDVAVALDQVFDVAQKIDKNPALAKEVEDKYGIFRAFSGLGYAVKGSANDVPLTADQIILNLIAPEYTALNLTLREGGCRCVLVPPYPGRSEDPVDPDFVWKEGGSDACRMVPRLRPRGPHTKVARE